MDFTGILVEKDGSFSYRIKKVLPSGERIDTKIKGFPSKRDAKNARDMRLAELNALRGKRLARRIRYDDLFAEFLENNAKNNRKYATLRRYESLHNNHISPEFGERWVDSLTPTELSKFLRTLQAQGLSHGYIDSFHKQLRVVLHYGVRCGYLPENPVDSVEMPTKDIAEAHAKDVLPQILSQNEITALLRELEGKSVLTPFLLGYCMGLRVSEAYAIRWCDVDFEAKTLRIDKQLQYQDRMWCLVPPKSYRGYRTIDMPDFLVAFLGQKREEQAKNREMWGRAYRKSRVTLRLKPRQDDCLQLEDFVCVKPSGELLTPCSAKTITRAATELGIDGYHFHLLRHTHASGLANSNVSALLLRERLGHEKVETTWSFYSHVTQEAREALSRALNSTAAPQVGAKV